MAAPEGWEAFTVEATRRSELVFLWTPRNRDLAHQVEQLLGGRLDWLPQVHQRFLAKDFWCRNGYPLEALIKNLHQFAPRQLRPAVKKIYTPTCDHADMEPAFKTQSDGSQLVTWTCTCGHVETETRTEEEIAAAQRFLQGAGVDLAAVAGT